MMTIPDVLTDSDGPCPACGGSEWKQTGQVKDYSVSGEWFELRECLGCGLRKTHPQPEATVIGRYYASQEYISHSDTRTGLTNKLYHLARTYMMKMKWRWVTEASGRGTGKLLDVGAGTGHFAHYLKTQGWEVVALEPDETARKVGYEKLGLSIEPLESLVHQPADSYDVITLWHVLEHVHDIHGYMEHFRTLLKPSGTLLIAVPNYTSTDADHYQAQWAAYDVPRHLWHFSPVAMEKLFERHAFSLVGKKTMPLDAFYVSMLSERYRGNFSFGPVTAFFHGLQSFRKSRHHVDRSSSIIYQGRPIK